MKKSKNGKFRNTQLPNHNVLIWLQAEKERFLTINVCNNSIQESNLSKPHLEYKLIDSIVIFSNSVRENKSMSKSQIKQFVNDWNSSETRGYYPNEPFDLAFTHMIPYQYKITAYSAKMTHEFYGYNYVILHSSNWKFEMNKTKELNYFHDYWNK